ncbi:MAG TPA: sigma-70 family RNA polymerase sigma factor [Polyangiaceae bacterium]|jgi:RNA polymerase sigma-70 factor (ECF subfamily)
MNFEQAYREHFAFVWRSLRHLGVPDRDLPDACQDVFLVLHKKLSELAAAARLTTWLYGTCLRVASDRRRRASARNEVLSAETLERAQAHDGDARRVELTDQRALLAAALDAMSLEQRAVFALFELEGATGAEIASLLDVPEATVYSRLRLAREIFRRVLDRARSGQAFAGLLLKGIS